MTHSAHVEFMQYNMSQFKSPLILWKHDYLGIPTHHLPQKFCVPLWGGTWVISIATLACFGLNCSRLKQEKLQPKLPKPPSILYQPFPSSTPTALNTLRSTNHLPSLCYQIVKLPQSVSSDGKLSDDSIPTILGKSKQNKSTSQNTNMTEIIRYLNLTPRLINISSSFNDSNTALTYARTLFNMTSMLSDQAKEQLNYIWEEKCSDEYRERIMVGIKNYDYQDVGSKEDKETKIVDGLLKDIRGMKNLTLHSSRPSRWWLYRSFLSRKIPSGTTC